MQSQGHRHDRVCLPVTWSLIMHAPLLEFQGVDRMLQRDKVTDRQQATEKQTQGGSEHGYD